jgi:class 3 adenylate cyclase/tetratricopeptide (TPR) repeat protein
MGADTGVDFAVAVAPGPDAVDTRPALVAPSGRLKPYVPRLLIDWLRNEPDRTYQEVVGTLAFVDISGFTRLTERLARHGKVGAEEMSDILNSTFAALLDVAYLNGASLVKWGGDAVLLLFDGPQHAERACRAAYHMRDTMRRIGRLTTTAGNVTLRMSVGVHSDTFHFFLVGDPAYHRELIVSGPAASTTAVIEGIADAGEIGISASTAALLDPRCVGRRKDEALLLRAVPDVAEVGIPPGKDVQDLDLTAVLPLGIREHLLAEPGEAEHRTIAVAFVQFSGTDALLAGEGPQALADALGEAMANVQDATASNGVTFFETDINRDGGKVMLTAGAPISRGHDDDRMLRAVRLVVERAGRLPLRVGVNRGPVFSGDFGPFFRKTYSVKGDAINLAARVMGKAAAGEVLATRAVVEHARTAFVLTDVPPFMVKGKSRPIDAVRLGPVVDGHSEPATTAELPPLRGRRDELVALDTALAGLESGAGTFVRVFGEPGIGKTRLMQEVERLAGARTGGALVIKTACDELEEGIPYLSVRRLFRAAVGLPPEAGAAASAGRLQDLVSASAPHLTPWLPLLGIVVGVDLPPTPETARLAEEFRKNRLEEVALDLLGRLLTGPVVVVVDDVHFADDASLDLLVAVAELAAERPWLVLFSGRDDRRRAALDSGLTPSAVVTLVGLSADDSRALLEDLTPDEPLPPATLATLVERSGGNPLFLRGLLMASRVRGDLDRLPDTVEDLVIAEIDRLPPAHRRLLRYAAVLGTAVDEELLREMLADDDLDPGPGAFRPLQAFVRFDGPGRLRFRHALIRDAAYAGLPYRRRRELHDLVGTRLLARMADPAATPEPLALHFFHAGHSSQAWTYCRLAGERARGLYAHAEAARFLEWAAESGRRAAVPAGELGQVLEDLGDVRYLMGLSPDASRAYRQALHASRGDPVRQAALLLKEGRLQQRMGNLALSQRRLTQGLRLLDGLDATTALAIHSRLATRYGIARLHRGRYGEARRWGALALGLGEMARDPLALAEAHNVLEAAATWSGEATEFSHAALALDLYTQIEDLTGQGHSLNNLAVRAVLEGRWDEAQVLIRRAAEAFARSGDEASLATAAYNEADVLVRQGRVAEAEPLLQKAQRVARSVGDQDVVLLATREAGKAAARAGRFDEARGMLTEAGDRLAAEGEVQEAADAWAAIAESYLLEGRWRQALEEADRVLAGGQAGTAVLPTLHRVRGFAQLMSGDVSAARASFAARLDAAASPQVGLEQALLQAGMARVMAITGDPVAADLEVASRTTLDALGVVSAPLPPGW